MGKATTRLLEALLEPVEALLEKADTENKDWLKDVELSPKEKAAALKEMQRMERAVFGVLDQQHRNYLTRIKALPTLTKNGGPFKLTIPVHGVDDSVISGLVYMLSTFVFTEDEKYADDLATAYQETAVPFFKEIATLSAQAVRDSTVNKISVLTRRADDWLKSHKIKFAQDVSAATHDAVVEVLRSSLASGADRTANDLVHALPQFFKQDTLAARTAALSQVKDVDIYNEMYAKLEKDKAFEMYRARRIARSETIPAANAAKLEGWRQSAVVTEKEWMCAGGPRSRQAHKDADGQTVPIDEPFIVGGEKLMHPGDSSMGASAKNTINCRCTMRAKVRAQTKQP